MKILSFIILAQVIACISYLLCHSASDFQGKQLHNNNHDWANENHRRTMAAQANQITVAIMSDRFEGLVTTIGGIMRLTSTAVRIILIGDAAMNERVRQHFQNRPVTLVTMTVKEAQNDLVSQGFHPIWNWDEWHSSHAPGWKSNNTIHVADWDNLHTHEHVLNHVSLYLVICDVICVPFYFA